MKKVNKIAVIFIIMIVMLIGFTSAVKANYQSNDGTKVSDTLTTFSPGIRAMEGSGQVMGFTETFNTSTLKATTSSNNIDVHMVKNTEWGAMALLSASQDYGKKGSGTARYVVKGSGLKTTTGNAYGIYISGNKNVTAGGGHTLATERDARYKDVYNSAGARKNGDALLNWHEKASAKTVGTWYDSVYFRGGNGIFSFDGYNSSGAYQKGYSRAAITNGQGI